MTSSPLKRSLFIPSLTSNFDVVQPDGLVVDSLPLTRPAVAVLEEAIIPQKLHWKKSRSQWKTFSHYKRVVSDSTVAPGIVEIDCLGYIQNGYARISVPATFANFGWRAGSLGMFRQGLTNWYAEDWEDVEYNSIRGVISIPDEQVDELKAMSYRHLLPLIKSQLSLINTIIELKDFVTLKHTIRRLGTLVKPLLRKNASFSLSQLAGLVSDVYLQYKFNIATLISDIQGLHRAMSKTLGRIRNHLSYEGRPQISHYARYLDELPEKVITEWPWELVNNGATFGLFPNNATKVYTRREVLNKPTFFHAQMQYNANYTAFQREHARGLALLDAFGVNFNPAIVWNAVPWTFIVDWVFRVGDFLDNLKVGNMDPQINIMQYLWSVKRERQITVTVQTAVPTLFASSNLHRHTSTTYPVITETAYHRQVDLPEASSLSVSGLSLTELSLGAALVTARRTRTKKSERRVKRLSKSLKHVK